MSDPHNDQEAARAREDFMMHVESARATLAQGDRTEALVCIATTLEEEEGHFTRNRLCALLATALVLTAEGAKDAGAEEAVAAERERIAQAIEDELVCCDIYRRIEDAYRDARDATGGHEEGVAAQRSVMRSSDYHAICHHGAHAAAIARGSVAGKEGHQ